MRLRLKQIRQRKGISQAEAAHALGWTTATLSRLENGKQNTKISALKELAEFYGVSVPELFEYEGDNPLIRIAWTIPADKAAAAAEMLEVYARHLRDRQQSG